MNIFALIVVILFIASGYLVGKFLALYYGLLGWIVGFLIGFFLALLLYYLLMHYWNKWFPCQPTCKKGKCTEKDYELVEYNQKDGTFVFRCKCGTKYFQNLPYFSEMLPDGSMKPYMKKNSLGRWEMEKLCDL